MDRDSNSKVRFGDLTLDTNEKTVWRGGDTITMQPRVFDVLCLLVEKRGDLVTKDELMESVWKGSFVEEGNITQCIYTLRRKLGTTSDGKDLIQTIPKRGYRLTVPVEPFVKPSDITRDSGGAASNVLPSTRRVKRSLSTTALILAILILVVTVFSVARYWNVRELSPIESVKFQRLTFSGEISSPVISPDGKSFAFVKGDSMHLQDVATGTSVKLEIPEVKKYGNLQFSVGGESIYFRNETSFDAAGDLFQVSRFGGPAKRIAERIWSTVGFSPDGSTFAFVRFYPEVGEWALLTRTLENGNETKLIGRNLPYSLYRSGFPAWSPDGTQIAIVEQTPEQVNASSILIVNASTGETRKLSTPRFIQIEQLGWIPNGDRLLVTGRENNRFFQLWTMDLTGGEVQPITNDLNIYRNLSVSADGKRVLARQYSMYSHIWVADAADLSRPEQITFGNLNRDGNAGIAWASDGRIVYSSRIVGDIDIWSVLPTGGIRRQLTANAGTNNENPFPTADGRSIFFESTRTGRRCIWRTDADGSNPTQITFGDNGTDFLPVVSTDGTTLYYIQRNPRSNIVWKKSLIDGSSEMLTQPGELFPSSFLTISPDGKSLAFENIKPDAKPGGTQVGIVDLADTRTTKLISIDTPSAQISWTADGKSIDYVENTSSGAKFWRQQLDPSANKKLLFELPKDRIYTFDWSPDGLTLAIARGRQDSDAILLTGF